MSRRKRFEYKILQTGEYLQEKLTLMLDKLGEEGWELASAPDKSVSGNYYFKREILEGTQGTPTQEKTRRYPS